MVCSLALVGCGERTTAEPQIDVHPEEVRGLPVLWLGEAYDSDGDGDEDMELTVGQYNVSPELRDPATSELIRPEMRSYLIGYGTCEIPEGVRGCPIPISITIYDPCTAPPLAEEVVRDNCSRAWGGRARVRGGKPARRDG